MQILARASVVLNLFGKVTHLYIVVYQIQNYTLRFNGCQLIKNGRYTDMGNLIQTHITMIVRIRLPMSVEVVYNNHFLILENF